MNAKLAARVWAIAKKDIRIYYLKGPVVIFGLLLPLFLYLAYALGRSVAAKEAIASVTSMTVFFTSTAVAPVIAPWETRSRTFERLISSPVNIAIILVGDALASVIFGICITAAVSILGVLMGVYAVNIPLFALNLALSSICFSFFGLLLSSHPSDTPADVMMLSALLKFPLVFISGVFMPVSSMPPLVRSVALLSPLTYTTELFRRSIYAGGVLPIHLAVAALTAYTLIFAVAAIKLHERSAPKRL